MPKSLSPEHREAIAAGLRGKPKSAEHCQKLSAARLGSTASPEARDAMSRAGRGKPKSPEHRAAIGDALRGKHKTSGAPSYHQVHARLGRASDHQCPCGKLAQDWAYQYTATLELVSPEGWPYSTDPADYLPMCRSCHKKLDHNQ